MRRCQDQEILDQNELSPEAVTQVYSQLQQVNRWLGNTSAIVQSLRRQHTTDLRVPRVPRVLDIGCGQGGLLVEIRKRLGFEVVGFDLRPAPAQSPVPILTGNAVSDPLPEADVAICVMLAHHLSESELAGMISNVSRSCQRFVILDLVRHPAPLWLFRIFVAPLLGRINALDGQTSIRRAYTANEMRGIVEAALSEGNRKVRSCRHSVTPFWTRQLVDICWETQQ